MYHRTCVLPSRSSCLLLGPRQTGKSTLVRSALPNDAWSVDLLEHDVALRYAKDPSQFRREVEGRIARGTKTFFVDEVQKVPELMDEVHRLIERTKLRFILTGSSARKLRRGGANLLAGRAVVRRLHPLTMSEYGDAFDLERCLRFGALPPVAAAEDDVARRDLLEAYAETYLREEIQAEAIVRNLGGFARFLDIAASQCGDIVNFSAVGRDAGLATRTVQEYFQVLEDTLLGFRLEAWRSSPRARLVAHPRFYLFDTGVTNALNRRLTAPPDPQTRGRLFEQWAVLECKRILDYRNDETQIFFWRTNVGTEVDLIVERHGKVLLAAEIKSKTKVASADLTGLKSFGADYPKAPLFVVCTAPEEYRIGNVRIVPYRQFFEECL